MKEVTEEQFFAEIKRLGRLGRDPMPGRDGIWRDQSGRLGVVGRSEHTGECGDTRYFLAVAA